MRQPSLPSSARVLSGLLAFAVCSAAPGRALADGSELVTGIAPATPPPPLAEPSSSQPASPQPPSPSEPVDRKVAALVLGGVAVVAAAGGAVFGVLALNDKSSFESRPTFHAADSANENAVLSDVCFGGAVVAAVTSIVLFVRSGEAPAALKQSHVTFTLSPMITPHGGGAGAALRF
jgi:hypothetical protein